MIAYEVFKRAQRRIVLTIQTEAAIRPWEVKLLQLEREMNAAPGFRNLLH